MPPSSFDMLSAAGVIDLSSFVQLLAEVWHFEEEEKMLDVLLQSGACSVDCKLFAEWLRGDAPTEEATKAAAAAAQGPEVEATDDKEQQPSARHEEQVETEADPTPTRPVPAEKEDNEMHMDDIRQELATWSWAEQEKFHTTLKRITRKKGAGKQSLQELDDMLDVTLQELADGVQVWRNIRYGEQGDRKLPVFSTPVESDPVDEVLFGARLWVLEERDVEGANWLRVGFDRALGQGEHWVLARHKDGDIQCLPLPSQQTNQTYSGSGRTPEEAFQGQTFPEVGMYTEGYAGGSNICLISASGDALWREVNMEMLARDIATSTVFEQQWGGDANFTDWVAYYATNVVVYGQLQTDFPKDLIVTVKHTKDWPKYIGSGLPGPAVEDVKKDIGRAQFKECEWLFSMQKRLNLDWSKVRFVTAFTFLCEHCGWTEQDCQEVTLAKLLDFLSAPKEDSKSDIRAAESQYWRCREAFAGMADTGSWPDNPKISPLLSLSLKVLATLTALNLWSAWVGDEELLCIIEVLQASTCISALCLKGDDKCKIGDKHVKAISEALKVNTALTQLNLEHNNAGIEGAQALAEALKVNTTLTELNLHCNTITDEGARVLAEALKVNTTLTKLDLGANFIQKEGGQALAEANSVHPHQPVRGLDKQRKYVKLGLGMALNGRLRRGTRVNG